MSNVTRLRSHVRLPKGWSFRSIYKRLLTNYSGSLCLTHHLDVGDRCPTSTVFESPPPSPSPLVHTRADWHLLRVRPTHVVQKEVH